MNSSVLHFTQQSHLPIKKPKKTMIIISICALFIMAWAEKNVNFVFAENHSEMY